MGACFHFLSAGVDELSGVRDSCINLMGLKLYGDVLDHSLMMYSPEVGVKEDFVRHCRPCRQRKDDGGRLVWFGQCDQRRAGGSSNSDRLGGYRARVVSLKGSLVRGM